MVNTPAPPRQGYRSKRRRIPARDVLRFIGGPATTGSAMSGKSFIDDFSALADPRQARKVVCPLPEIPLLVLGATLSGAEDFVEIARRHRRKRGLLRRLLPCALRNPALSVMRGSKASVPAIREAFAARPLEARSAAINEIPCMALHLCRHR
jgi:surfactin synthase thioesterase subunit